MKQFITAQDTKRQNMGFSWLLFFVFPLLSFIFAIKNYQIKKYRIFIYGFLLFYGFTFLPIPKSDGSRYKATFESSQTYDSYEYFKDIKEILNGDSEYTDFYQITLKFVAKQLSEDSRFYFLLAASIYFFVLLKLISTHHILRRSRL